VECRRLREKERGCVVSITSSPDGGKGGTNGEVQGREKRGGSGTRYAFLYYFSDRNMRRVERGREKGGGGSGKRSYFGVE